MSDTFRIVIAVVLVPPLLAILAVGVAIEVAGKVWLFYKRAS